MSTMQRGPPISRPRFPSRHTLIPVTCPFGGQRVRAVSGLHYDQPTTLRDERCPVQARALSPSAGRPKLEALDDVREDLPQLQQSERGAQAPPLTAAEWKPRPRIGVAAKKPLGDKCVWHR